MKRYIFDFLKGLLLGFICVATPGVSGGTVAVIIGLFSTIIENGNNLFKNWFSKEWYRSVLFFIILMLGIVSGALIGGKVAIFTYNRFPYATTLCLIGFIVGSFYMLFNNIKSYAFKLSNIITFVVILTLALVYTFTLKESNSADLTNMTITKYILLAIMGIVSVVTMIVPGISGSIFLMAFGYYYPLVSIISNVKDALSNYLLVLIVYIIGCAIGAILVIKVFKYLFEKFNEKTNVSLFAFVVSSPIIMIRLLNLNNVKESILISTNEKIVGIILCIIALVLSFIICLRGSKTNANNEVVK